MSVLAAGGGTVLVAVKSGSKKPDWAKLERATQIAAREDYERTTPGQRVEEQIELSRELTALASRSVRTK